MHDLMPFVVACVSPTLPRKAIVRAVLSVAAQTDEKATIGAARFRRVVAFWNLGPILTTEDCERVLVLFADDPGPLRPVYEGPTPATAAPTLRRVLFDLDVSSGSILPPQMVFGLAPLRRWDSPNAPPAPPQFLAALPGEQHPQPVPERPAVTPRSYEVDRQIIGRVLAELVAFTRGDASAGARVRERVTPWHLGTITCAIYDELSPTGARLWIAGVTGICAAGILEFLDQPDLHSRFAKCGAPGCPRYVFTPPGWNGRPRAHCDERHAQQVRDARRRNGDQS
jgi:hypothetical protein